MRTGESLQRVKLVARMPPTHFMFQQALRCFFNLGPRVIQMLRVPRYLNPALAPARTEKRGQTYYSAPCQKFHSKSSACITTQKCI